MTNNSPSVSRIKAASEAANRYRRAKARALKRRRDDLLLRLAEAIPPGHFDDDLLSGGDAFKLLVGHLAGAKAVARRVARRAVINADRSLPEAGATPLADIPRPTRVVAEANRPATLPGLVDEQADDRLLAIEEAIAIARQEDARGLAICGMLDRFHSTSGLSWDCAAAILIHEGILPRDFGVDAIAMVAGARSFWSQWELCRKIHRNAILLGQVPPADGDWGLIEAPNLGDLLLGFAPPRSAARNEYLARIIRRPSSMLLDLDFHAMTYRPLFRLPL